MTSDHDFRAESADGLPESRLRGWADWARAGAPEVTVPDPTQRPVRRRLSLAAACLAVLIVVGVVFAVRAFNDSDGTTAPAGPTSTRLGCPPRFDGYHAGGDSQPWVPQPPTIDTHGRLTPDQPPSAAVVCAYERKAPDAPARVTLNGDLAALTRDLYRVGSGRGEQACASYLATTDAQNFLIGLRVGDGVVWVSAPGDHCAGSGNGSVSSGVNLRADAQQAYRTHRWDTDPKSTVGCDQPATHGPEPRPIVAPGSTGLTVCVASDAGWRAYVYPADDEGELGEELHYYSKQLAPAGCVVAARSGGVLVIFHYQGAADLTFAATPRCGNGLPAPTPQHQDLIQDILIFHVDRI